VRIERFDFERYVDPDEPTAEITVTLGFQEAGEQIGASFREWLDDAVFSVIGLCDRYGQDRDEAMRPFARMLRNAADLLDPPQP
jgi:hypothetical protein